MSTVNFVSTAPVSLLERYLQEKPRTKLGKCYRGADLVVKSLTTVYATGQAKYLEWAAENFIEDGKVRAMVQEMRSTREVTQLPHDRLDVFWQCGFQHRNGRGRKLMRVKMWGRKRVWSGVDII